MRQKSLRAAALAIVLGSLGAPRASGSTADGSCMEVFGLRNFQPRSSTFNQTVKTSSYKDLTTVVMLLSSG